MCCETVYLLVCAPFYFYGLHRRNKGFTEEIKVVCLPSLFFIHFWLVLGFVLAGLGGARVDGAEGQSFLNLPLNETGRSLLQCMLVMEGVSGKDGDTEGEPRRLRRCGVLLGMFFCSQYICNYTRRLLFSLFFPSLFFPAQLVRGFLPQRPAEQAGVTGVSPPPTVLVYRVERFFLFLFLFLSFFMVFFVELFSLFFLLLFTLGVTPFGRFAWRMVDIRSPSGQRWKWSTDVVLGWRCGVPLTHSRRRAWTGGRGRRRS